MYVNWIMLNQKYFDVFKSEDQVEIPEGKDLSKPGEYKAPPPSFFRNEFSLNKFDCPCIGYGSVCNKE